MFKETYRIPGSLERVFDALTEEGHLSKWFAEHVDVEARAGGRYRFWGRHTLWTPSPEAADQTITHFAPPHALAFSWTWNGSSTEVSLRLARREDRVELDLCHTFDSRFRYEERDELVLSFWGLSMANLRRYVDRGEPALLPDLETPEREIRLEITIDATAEKVFRALTDPRQLDRWISNSATIEAAVGGVYSYGWKTGGPSRVLELVPDRLLVHDWSVEGEPATRVRWELEPLGDRTRVTLTHSPFQSDKHRLGHRLGWSALLTVLQRLSTRVEL